MWPNGGANTERLSYVNATRTSPGPPTPTSCSTISYTLHITMVGIVSSKLLSCTLDSLWFLDYRVAEVGIPIRRRSGPHPVRTLTTTVVALSSDMEFVAKYSRIDPRNYNMI